VFLAQFVGDAFVREADELGERRVRHFKQRMIAAAVLAK
jgi:hypothetical protein